MGWGGNMGRWRMVSIGLALALLGVLVISVGLLWQVFSFAQQYYRELNAVRLDPLGTDVIWPDVPPLAEGQQRLVLFGDSRAQDWPLTGDDRLQVVNRGIGAQTTAQISGRFEQHVVPLKPDIIVIQAGINDLKTIPIAVRLPDDLINQTARNLRRIVDQSLAIGADVILTTIFPVGAAPLERQLFFWSDDVGEAVVTLNDRLRAWESDRLHVLDTYTLLAGEGSLIQPAYALDTLHLNAAGYAALDGPLREQVAALLAED